MLNYSNSTLKFQHETRAFEFRQENERIALSKPSPVEYSQNPILKTFIELLSESDPSKRVTNYILFEQRMSEISSQARRELGAAAGSDVQEYLVTPEHLWREMASLYSSVPAYNLSSPYEKYPGLAAMHLLDGFAIEMVDGDASCMNQVWFQAVIKVLEKLIAQQTSFATPKLFVLSILGLQKSGKSTLLNVMFGCRLRTNVERCTKGIYLQLIRSTRPGFDYVLVLDVEGVRSMEIQQGGQDQATQHDNRLAMLSVWCADATLILSNGVDQTEINKIVSVVNFITSKSGSQIDGSYRASRLFFIMRSVPQNYDKENFKRIIREALIKDFRLELQSMPEAADGFTGMFLDFSLEKDIFLLGSLTKGDKPPDDIPATDYGASVKLVRERIHEYFTARAAQRQWHPKSLPGWIKRVVEVQKEVSDLEPRLYILSSVDVSERERVEKFMGELKARVSKEYTNKLDNLAKDFESVIKDLRTLSKQDLIATIQQANIQISVDQVVKEQSTCLAEWFTSEKLLSWKDKYTETWQQFLKKQRNSSDAAVEELITARVFIGDEVDKAKTKITKAVIALCEKHDFKQRQGWTQAEKEKMFLSIYDKVYDEVITAHPFESTKVAQYISDIYKANRQYFMKPLEELMMLKKISS